MVRALAETVREHLRMEFDLRTRAEGSSDTGWVLADYGDFVVHLFSEDQRSFYRLEDFWSEGKVIVHLH